MMKAAGLITRKVGMTRMFDEEGRMVPVTLLAVEPQRVTKVLTPDRDGYHGIQVGYAPKAEKRLNKPDIHRLRKAEIEENFTCFREYRFDSEPKDIAVGSTFTAELIAGVDVVNAEGISKGRGFQGAVKRWNAKTGRNTHGSHFHRRPGSLGQRSTPGRVYKNKHMPGHMGSKRVTTANLSVLDVDKDKNIIALRGSVPGHKNGIVILKVSAKASTNS